MGLGMHHNGTYFDFWASEIMKRNISLAHPVYTRQVGILHSFPAA